MQIKSAIIVLAISLGLVSLYQLSFTAATYMVKRDAKEYAQGDLVKEAAYLDSIASLPKDEWSYLGNTFRECQKKELNLGLDLKGGMNVILEVSVEDILRALSSYSTDRTFNAAIERAKEMQTQSQSDFLTLFGQAFSEIDPNARLAAIFGTVQMQEQVNFNSSNAEVLRALDAEVTTAIDNAFNILRTRIDRFGVVQPNITQLATKGRILIELPGQNDPKRVRELLRGTASLEFWETYENAEVIGYLSQANELLKAINVTGTVTGQQTTTADTAVAAAADTAQTESSLLDIINQDTTTAAEPATMEEFARQNPLFGLLNPRVSPEGQPLQSCMVGLAAGKDTARVNAMLAMNQIRVQFPRDLRFMWSQEPHKYDPTATLYELHAIRITTRDGRPPLDGDVVTSARPTSGVTGSEVKVDMSMNVEGSNTWARMTRENIGRCIVVALDGYVRSYPRVQNEITGGSTEITGDFTIEEADDLANILKSGKLPAPARIISDTVVGPTLGKEAINAGLISFIIAFVLVLLYMVFYYSMQAGLIADVALLTNVFLLFGTLASLGAALTLPGIAGIVLTMGMAVDANVLIYERIREELRHGKGARQAIADGYKMAYSSIIDSNVTTLLVGIILYIFGTGPIKGFATTLVIGVLTSLFSAIFITRIIYDAMLKKNPNAVLTFSRKVTANFLKNTNIDFIGLRKYFYAFSIFITVVGVGSLFVRGLSMGIDFTGGRTFQVRFDEAVNPADVAQNLSGVFGELPQVVTFGNDHQVKITTKYRITETGIEDEVDAQLYEGLKGLLPADTGLDEFLSTYMVSSDTIGPAIAADIKIKAVYAVIFSLIIMFLYILMRFRNWQYGLGAVTALFHDTLIIIGFYSLLHGIMPFSMDIDQSFIAAILTIIGYSVLDTVIVFDRLREYIPMYRKKPLQETLNMAMNATLSRTVNTSLTTLLTVLAIFIFGGAVIRGFIFALIIGVVMGTYSSIFIASMIMYDTTKQKAIQ
ncbi:MAG: protein translocase subunit SecDF [Bacteroidales bacterium]|jgi:SecD/SecF fusion protein|nr:protein translocase subunit SecDF [Bacteroidales bacterium]